MSKNQERDTLETIKLCAEVLERIVIRLEANTNARD